MEIYNDWSIVREIIGSNPLSILNSPANKVHIVFQAIWTGTSRVQNLLDFIVFFLINDFWRRCWRSRPRWKMVRVIRLETRDMEDIVDLDSRR